MEHRKGFPASAPWLWHNVCNAPSDMVSLLMDSLMDSGSRDVLNLVFMVSGLSRPKPDSLDFLTSRSLCSGQWAIVTFGVSVEDSVKQPQILWFFPFLSTQQPGNWCQVPWGKAEEGMTLQMFVSVAGCSLKKTRLCLYSRTSVNCLHLGNSLMDSDSPSWWFSL